MTKDDWDLTHARFLFYVARGTRRSGQAAAGRARCADTPVEITAPEWQGVRAWRRVLDTTNGSEPAELAPGGKWDTQARCVLAFAGQPLTATRQIKGGYLGKSQRPAAFFRRLMLGARPRVRSHADPVFRNPA